MCEHMVEKIGDKDVKKRDLNNRMELRKMSNILRLYLTRF